MDFEAMLFIFVAAISTEKKARMAFGKKHHFSRVLCCDSASA
jgi:hypothetical protein